MKKSICTGITVALLGVACSNSKNEEAVTELPVDETAVFTSSNKQLEDTYKWAKKMALSYSHDGSDPVGYWYEAALPAREAFCMRDVSHQSVGAQVLGLEKHNLNMFTRFVENISESKDWCTYWEINRYNLPAPADYTNDREFWYNLNANFDVIQACLKMYEWTGDETYLKNPKFTYFYEKSFNDYIERWMLEPDKLMDRPLFMNSPENFNPNNNFHTCRGLASYVENFRTLTMSSDLLACIYAGYKAYATISYLNGDQATAEKARQSATEYRDLLENKWWDAKTNSYYNFWTSEKTFHQGEGDSFILWLDATDRPERIRATMSGLLAGEWNAENTSHFPVLFYRLGYDEEAYKTLVALPGMHRSEYPEVSYGAVEGIASGVMGLTPSAINNRIMTISRLGGEAETAELKNVPVFAGYVSIEHTGRKESRFTNNTGKSILWRAAFKGDHAKITINGETHKAITQTDVLGNVYSYIDTEIANGETLEAKI